ncbi:UNVERIFIED_CONTAM: hypothetical protein HDU68_001870 [Siphonaria sp. JEL0065]|nr:hypothetical protein HDU68_001870 [Siphonaria sp. JEL0065]
MFSENIKVVSSSLLLMTDDEQANAAPDYAWLDSLEKDLLATTTAAPTLPASDHAKDSAALLDALTKASIAFASFAAEFSGAKNLENQLLKTPAPNSAKQVSTKDADESVSLFKSRIESWLPLQKPFLFTDGLDEAVKEMYSVLVEFQEKMGMFQSVRRDWNAITSHSCDTATHSQQLPPTVKELNEMIAKMHSLRQEMNLLNSNRIA